MRINGTTVPTGRDSTYNPDEVTIPVSSSDDGGGGGASVDVKVVTGTALNPWGDLDFLTLCDDIASGVAVAEITLLMQDAIPITVLLSALTYNLRASYVNYNPIDGSFMATFGIWTSAGLSRLDVWQGTGESNGHENYSGAGALIQTEVKVIYVTSDQGEAA